MRYEWIPKILWSFLLVILLLPVMVSWVGSFHGAHGGSLETYTKALLGHRRFLLLRNTLLWGLCTAAAATLLDAPLALIVGRTDTSGWRTAVPILLVPLRISPYLRAVAWIHLLGSEGFIAKTLANGKISWIERSMYGLPTTTPALTLGLFPIPALCALGSLLVADSRLEEEARLHTRPLRVLWKVSFPMALPGILSGAVLAFLLAVVNFGVVDQLFYRVYPTEVFAQFSAFYDGKAAMAVVAAGLVQRFFRTTGV